MKMFYVFLLLISAHAVEKTIYVKEPDEGEYSSKEVSPKRNETEKKAAISGEMDDLYNQLLGCNRYEISRKQVQELEPRFIEIFNDLIKVAQSDINKARKATQTELDEYFVTLYNDHEMFERYRNILGIIKFSDSNNITKYLEDCWMLALDSMANIKSTMHSKKYIHFEIERKASLLERNHERFHNELCEMCTPLVTDGNKTIFDILFDQIDRLIKSVKVKESLEEIERAELNKYQESLDKFITVFSNYQGQKTRGEGRPVDINELVYVLNNTKIRINTYL